MDVQSLDPANPLCMFEMSKVCATCTHKLLEGRSYSLDTLVDEAANVNLYHVLESQFQYKCNENGPSNLCAQCFSKTLLFYDFHQQCTESATLFNKYLKCQEQRTTQTTLDDTDLNVSDMLVNSTGEDEEPEKQSTMEPEVIYLGDDSTLEIENEGNHLNEEESIDNNLSLNNTLDSQILPSVSEDSLECNKSQPLKRRSSRLKDKSDKNNDTDIDLHEKDVEEEIQIHIVKAKKKKQYNCALCSAGFDTHSTLQYHKITEHERRFVCSHCGKALWSEHMLEVHEKTHAEEQPLEC